MTMLPLNWKRSWAQTEKYVRIAFVPLKRKKTSLHKKFMLCEGGSDHCSKEYMRVIASSEGRPND